MLGSAPALGGSMCVCDSTGQLELRATPGIRRLRRPLLPVAARRDNVRKWTAVMELAVEPGPEPGSFVVRSCARRAGGEPRETVTVDLEGLIAARGELEWRVLASSVPPRAACFRKPRRPSRTSAAGSSIPCSAARSAPPTAQAWRWPRSAARHALALRLAAPGLAALPWEALFDRETQSTSAAGAVGPARAGADAPAALTIAPPLRVLGMVSSPCGLAALDIDGERERLEEALRTAYRGRARRAALARRCHVVRGPRPAARREWHVLHFIGHGAFDPTPMRACWPSSVAMAEPTTSRPSLAGLLHEAEPTPRLVVLNSCQSGAAGTSTFLRHGRGTRAWRHPRGRGDAVLDQRQRRDRVRPVLHGPGVGRPIDEAVRSGRIGVARVNGTRWSGSLRCSTSVAMRNCSTSRPRRRLWRRSSPRPNALPGQICTRSLGQNTPNQGARQPRSPPDRSRGGDGLSSAWLRRSRSERASLSRPRCAWFDSPATRAGSGTGGSDSTAELAVPLDIDWVDVGLYCYPRGRVRDRDERTRLARRHSRVGDRSGWPVTDQSPETRVLPDENTGSVIGRARHHPRDLPRRNGNDVRVSGARGPAARGE